MILGGKKKSCRLDNGQIRGRWAHRRNGSMANISEGTFLSFLNCKSKGRGEACLQHSVNTILLYNTDRTSTWSLSFQGLWSWDPTTFSEMGRLETLWTLSKENLDKGAYHHLFQRRTAFFLREAFTTTWLQLHAPSLATLINQEMQESHNWYRCNVPGSLWLPFVIFTSNFQLPKSKFNGEAGKIVNSNHMIQDANSFPVLIIIPMAFMEHTVWKKISK